MNRLLKIRLILHTAAVVIRMLPTHHRLLPRLFPPRPLLPPHNIPGSHSAIIPACATRREELAVIVRRAGSIDIRDGFPGDFWFERE